MFPKKDKLFDFRQLRDQIGPDSDVYMKRRQLGCIRLGRYIIQLRINEIMRADRDPNPHTHPFPFLSVILVGSYLESIYTIKQGMLVITRTIARKVGSIAWRGRNSIHNIVEMKGPVKTLFISIVDIKDPHLGEWGFIVDGKLVLKEDYFKNPENQARQKLVN